jgi:hypothetical protein
MVALIHAGPATARARAGVFGFRLRQSGLGVFCPSIALSASSQH